MSKMRVQKNYTQCFIGKKFCFCKVREIYHIDKKKHKDKRL